MDRRRFNELPVEGEAAGLPNLEVRIGALLLRALAGVHRLVVAAFDWQWKRYLGAEERRVWSDMSPRQRADIGASPSGTADDRANAAFNAFWPP